MDAEERELLALQQQFMASKEVPAAKAVKLPSKFKVQAQSVQEKIPGERVELDLESDVSTTFTSGIIKDIVERDTSVQPTTPDNVIPQPAIRSMKIDWKSRKSHKLRDNFADTRDDLKKQIDEENNRQLASMSPTEIAQQREEILQTLRPGLVEKLLAKDKTNSARVQEDDDFGPKFDSMTLSAVPVVQSTGSTKDTNADRPTEATRQEVTKDFHAVSAAPMQDHKSVHFVSAPRPPALDPNSETFFEDLKSKYFPDLDFEPSSLDWMRSPTEAEEEADYSPLHEELMPAQLRFDFHGNFLTPKASREEDLRIGLHHHADAPSAAGYTIPELAHLCRSLHPAQSCLAIQTIGRIMYKIGARSYGESTSIRLQALIEKTRVEVTLLERARDKHLGISSYATEALWQANLGREGNVIHSA